jgi:hypothetical protein
MREPFVTPTVVHDALLESIRPVQLANDVDSRDFPSTNQDLRKESLDDMLDIYICST